MRALGYPLAMKDKIPEITEARNIELGLGLQVVFCCPFPLHIAMSITYQLSIFIRVMYSAA